MLVSVYIELANGDMYFLGRARMVGNTSYEQKFAAEGLKR
jgi:hypothetical protein